MHQKLRLLKCIACICIFQFICGFAYGQSGESLQKQELDKVLQQQLFPGTKSSTNTPYSFSNSFEELYIETPDNTKLHGLVFKAINAKGLIFYLHGSNGALDTWGKIASVYTRLNYDLFMLDYRGYGKSESSVTSEKQVYNDVQAAYDKLKLNYPESRIIVVGQSLGTGPAAMLAAYNHPKKLILQAPYYSLPDWINNMAPTVDTSDMKYQFKTYAFLQKTKAPVVIFHGDADRAIYIGSSQKLSAYFKPGDQLIILKGEEHNDFTKNPDYLEKLEIILK